MFIHKYTVVSIDNEDVYCPKVAQEGEGHSGNNQYEDDSWERDKAIADERDELDKAKVQVGNRIFCKFGKHDFKESKHGDPESTIAYFGLESR